MVFSGNGQWIGGEELRVFLFFGSAVSSWLEWNTLDSSELSCHDQQQEWRKVGSVARRSCIIMVCTSTIISSPSPGVSLITQ